MHEKWNENKLGIESYINGKCYCEIDGSKKININKERRLMLGIYDRGIIEYFMQITNRTRESLLPIIKNNVYTYFNSIENNSEPNEEFYPTRILQDCFLC